jgi:hypothetical protein
MDDVEYYQQSSSLDKNQSLNDVYKPTDEYQMSLEKSTVPAVVFPWGPRLRPWSNLKR